MTADEIRVATDAGRMISAWRSDDIRSHAAQAAEAEARVLQGAGYSPANDPLGVMMKSS